MKNHSSVTGFYLETLLLIVVFLSVILMLTQVFGLAQTQSTRAKQLTEAVVLAGNAAEAFAESESPEELLALLNESGNALPMEDAAGVTAYYASDLKPEADGAYRVDVSWLPETTEKGMMVRGVVEVLCGTPGEPVYRLETEAFHPEVRA